MDSVPFRRALRQECCGVLCHPVNQENKKVDMTIRPKRPCKKRICTAITNNLNGFCDECQPQFKQREKAVRKQYDTRRDPKVKQWLNSARYKKARKFFLARHPMCTRCSTKNHPVLASILDHITPHKNNYTLFWDVNNFQALCKKCHDHKTAKYDSGFNNPQRNDYGK